jgi:hypothetical protein
LINPLQIISGFFCKRIHILRNFQNEFPLIIIKCLNFSFYSFCLFVNNVGTPRKRLLQLNIFFMIVY